MSTIDAVSKFGYAMFKSGPDVGASDVESATDAIELRILWGTNVLRVVHVLPSQAFYVGDDSAGTVAECHYVIPERILGVPRAPLVVSRDVSRGLSRGFSGSLRQRVILLPGARGYASLDGEGRMTLAQLVASGRATRSREVPDAYEFELPDRAEIAMDLPNSDIAFHFRATRAGKRLPSNWLANEPVVPVHGSVVRFSRWDRGVAGVLHAPDGRRRCGRTRRRSNPLMQKLLNASADREQTLRQSDDAAPENSVARGGGGAAARDSSGTMGARSAPAASHRYAVRGPVDNPDPHLQRQVELQRAATFGAVGLLSSMLASDPDAPTAHWGRDDSLGKDAVSALGNLWGDTIGQAAGSGGLGPSGEEQGGGGTADAIGLNDLGDDFGHGRGPGSDQGIGDGRGRPPRQHVVRSPRVVEAAVEVNGRIPREVIQRVVHENFGRFRLCYENGLRGNPALQGRVVVKFTIDRTGAVALNADGGSDLADAKVVQCVVRGFGNLSFPPPGGGMVTVLYPVVLSPE